MSQTFNIYDRQLTDDEIAADAHRNFVGGTWEELGALQLAFMIDRGLLPGHALLDIGCGALRGGIRFVDYLDAGDYFGMDINESLIRAGQLELDRAGLASKGAALLVDERFSFRRFDRQFDFAMAQSVFSHLPMNHIIKCLLEARHVLKPGGEFFATFFEAPESAFIESIIHTPGEVVTNFDRDPFHYSQSEFSWMASSAGMAVRSIGDWGHPRGQKMLSFKVAGLKQ